MDTSKKYLSIMPLFVILVANTIPFWGILFLGWDAFLIAISYWSEQFVVGLFQLLLLLLIIVLGKAKIIYERLATLIFTPFIMTFYGFIMSLYGMALFGCFEKTIQTSVRGNEWWAPLVFFQIIFYFAREVYWILPESVKFALLALFLSRVVACAQNILLRDKAVLSKPWKPLIEPFARLNLVQVTMVAGALLTKKFGSPVCMLLALIVLKTFLDIKLYLRQKRKRLRLQSAYQA